MAGAALSFQEFHQAIIDGCGNATLVIVIGALESLWSHHKKAWAAYAEDIGSGPEPNLRASVVAAHEEITDAIEAGDAARAHQLVVAHLATVSPMVIDHRAPRIDITGADTRFPAARSKLRRRRMVASNDEASDFDPEAVRAKYEAERDKRMVKGRAAIRDLAHDEVVRQVPGGSVHAGGSTRSRHRRHRGGDHRRGHRRGRRRCAAAQARDRLASA